MLNSPELFIACRYLKARKKGFFAFLTTLIAIGGTTLGVCALVITLAVMSGFQRDIRAKILGIQPHIYLSRVDGAVFDNYKDIIQDLRGIQYVKSMSPYIFGQSIIKKQGYTSGTGALIKGVDYKAENSMIDITDKLLPDNLLANNTIKKNGIILGSEIAKSINVTVGENVIAMFPSQLSSIPKMKKFQVEAIFHSGMYEYDTTLAYVDINTADEMFSFEGGVSGIAIMTTNFEKAVEYSKDLQIKLSYPYRTKSWIEMNKNLFSALKLEKIMMFIILALIIIVASFNIISNTLLLSVEKSKEVGILSAMGFSKFSISKIFFYEGIIVGSVGTVLGLMVGLLISYGLKNFDIFKLPQGVYYVDKLPVMIIPFDIISVCLCAFFITILSGLYPAYQVAKLEPLEAIKYG
ncbi:MAG: ABC transporter permease [Endomicrobiia bacterium]|nr:ABC transporter permease [Endomicrobiaceae bacterium]MDD3923001.1 ABC transporter permease [Endomicrobiaceae bacterium]MDD5101844.1 ABC transporter permease [Endomicrobiaceae bacterium]